MQSLNQTLPTPSVDIRHTVNLTPPIEGGKNMLHYKDLLDFMFNNIPKTQCICLRMLFLSQNEYTNNDFPQLFMPWNTVDPDLFFSNQPNNGNTVLD